MAKRSKSKKPQPMPRSPLREARPPLPDPDDERPESDSLRVMHYKAMLRLMASLEAKAPVTPIQDEVLFELALVGDDTPLEPVGTLHVVVTHRKDEQIIAWFATSSEDDDENNERSTYVPLGDEDIAVLFKTILFDYATDHPNALFYLPLTGARVRREPVNESATDRDLLWYWFDVLDLQYKFQIGAQPNLEALDEAVTTVSVKLDDVADFLTQLTDRVRESGVLGA